MNDAQNAIDTSCLEFHTLDVVLYVVKTDSHQDGCASYSEIHCEVVKSPKAGCSILTLDISQLEDTLYAAAAVVLKATFIVFS